MRPSASLAAGTAATPCRAAPRSGRPCTGCALYRRPGPMTGSYGTDWTDRALIRAEVGADHHREPVCSAESAFDDDAKRRGTRGGAQGLRMGGEREEGSPYQRHHISRPAQASAEVCSVRVLGDVTTGRHLGKRGVGEEPSIPQWRTSGRRKGSDPNDIRLWTRE